MQIYQLSGRNVEVTEPMREYVEEKLSRLDRYNDQITNARVTLTVRDVRSAGSGAAAASWVRTLHDGSVGGLTTRVLAMLLGMAPAVLFTTGVLHWRRRRAGRG